MDPDFMTRYLPQQGAEREADNRRVSRSANPTSARRPGSVSHRRSGRLARTSRVPRASSTRRCCPAMRPHRCVAGWHRAVRRPRPAQRRRLRRIRASVRAPSGAGTPRPARPSAQAGRDSTWLVSRRLPRGAARTATWVGDAKQHPIRSAPPRCNRRHGPHAQRRSHPSWKHGPRSAARRAGGTSGPRPSRRPRPGQATASRASRRPHRACPAAIRAGIPTVFRPRVGRAGP